MKSASGRSTSTGRFQLLDEPVVLLCSHRRRGGQECDSHHQPPTFQDEHILPHTPHGRHSHRAALGRDPSCTTRWRVGPTACSHRQRHPTTRHPRRTRLYRPQTQRRQTRREARRSHKRHLANRVIRRMCNDEHVGHNCGLSHGHAHPLWGWPPRRARDRQILEPAQKCRSNFRGPQRDERTEVAVETPTRCRTTYRRGVRRHRRRMGLGDHPSRLTPSTTAKRREAAPASRGGQASLRSVPRGSPNTRET